MLRPRLSVGLTRFLNARSPTSTAVFAGSPNGVSAFETSSKLKRTYLALDAGLEMTANQGWSLSLSRFGQLSGDIKSYGGSLQVAIPF